MIFKTTDIGRIGENAASKFLKSKKLKVIERNLHASHNEIDIIALNDKEQTIVFAEVKTRSVNDDLSSYFGSPASAVTKSKQKRTITAARRYLSEHPKYEALQPQFDVIEVYLSKNNKHILKINHIENAFGE